MNPPRISPAYPLQHPQLFLHTRSYIQQVAQILLEFMERYARENLRRALSQNLRLADEQAVVFV